MVTNNTTNEQEKTSGYEINFNGNPALFIGLGGTGAKALNSTKKMIKEKFGEIPKHIDFLVIDADQNEINNNTELSKENEFISANVTNPREWYQNHKTFAKTFYKQDYFPNSALYGAGEFRQVSRMCFFNNFQDIRTKITNKLNEINPMGQNEGVAVHINVFIVASLCGGAGSGMFIDIAALVKKYRKENNLSLDLFGLFVTGDVYLKFPEIRERLQTAEPIFLANTYAALKELQYFQNSKSEHLQNVDKPFEIKLPDNNDTIRIEEKLFELVLLIESVNRYGKVTIQTQQQLNEFLSETLFLLGIAPITKNIQGNWVNPIAGINETSRFYKGMPKFLSSTSFYKLYYPQEEILEFLRLYLPKELLKNTLYSQNDNYSSKFDEMSGDILKNDRPYDNQFLFKNMSNIKNFSQDEILGSFLQIAEKEKWQNIKNKLNRLKSDYENDFAKNGYFSGSLKNHMNDVNKDFLEYLDEIPKKLIEDNIGFKNIPDFLKELKEDFEQEKKDATEERYKVDLDQSTQDSESNYKEVEEIIDHKPFLFKRKKLSDRIENYSSSFYKYLSDSFSDLAYDFIVSFYDWAIEKIQEKLDLAESIKAKLTDIESELNIEEKLQRTKLNKLFDLNRTYFSSFFNFSIIDSASVSTKITTIDVKSSDKKNKLSEIYWKFASMKKEDIKNILIEPFQDNLEKFKMNLNKALTYYNIPKEKFQEIRDFYFENIKAQWNINDNILLPKSEKKIAYPQSFTYMQTNTKALSSSKQVIEILNIEYALPAKSLRSISDWKNKYDYRLKELKNSLHIFPEAENWDELNEFPSYEEATLLFALGLAFGEIYELQDNEVQALERKYGKEKQYKNFIFRRGNWYIFMPYYPNDSDPINLGSLPDYKEIERGDKGFRKQGILNAYEEFVSEPQYKDEMNKWLESRIFGQDVRGIVEKLVEYINNTLDPQKNASITPDIKELLDNMETVLNDYIEAIEENNYSTLDYRLL